MKSGSHSTATKGHTVKKRAYVFTLALLVALMVASGASAKKTAKHSISKKAERHMLVKAPGAKLAQKSVNKAALKRAARGTF